MPADGKPAVTLDRKFTRAIDFACASHAGQTRKGTTVPYAAHLLGVASLVLEDGGTQTEAIAALLHDSIEDTSITERDVRKRFGRKVARIVAACTDVPTAKRGRKKKPAKSGKARRAKETRRDATNWRQRNSTPLAATTRSRRTRRILRRTRPTPTRAPRERIAQSRKRIQFFAIRSRPRRCLPRDASEDRARSRHAGGMPARAHFAAFAHGLPDVFSLPR